MHCPPSVPRQNRLLAALPDDVMLRLLPHLEPCELTAGQTLSAAGNGPRCAWFPTTSIVALLYVMQDGASPEISVVGNDGIVGIAQFMGGETTPSRAVVQTGGQAYRINSQLLRQEFDRHGALLQLMLRYTQVLITQLAQTAVCNRYHVVDQQLCRWLLLSLDRIHGNQLQMTQELIANMLGVRRVGVTEAAGRLQKLGIIKYRRGLITVLNRQLLEQRCCECYEVVRRETGRLLNFTPLATSQPLQAGLAS